MSLVLALPVVAHAEASPDLASIPVVCEFLGVFPEDLPRLPPDRDIEFIIELEELLEKRFICPISRPPYRMAPKELAKMKK
jgi:hypothetical protein